MRGLELVEWGAPEPRSAHRTEKADSERTRSGHSARKQEKNRRERKRARLVPDCAAGYGRYSGYET